MPILNWRAGPAHNVAASIISRWEEIRTATGSPAPLYDVDYAQPAITTRGVRVNTPLGAVNFDFAILAIGFGVERTFQAAPFHSYWQSDDFDESDRQRNRRRRSFYISGNGDGGLIDFLRSRVLDSNAGSARSCAARPPRS